MIDKSMCNNLPIGSTLISYESEIILTSIYVLGLSTAINLLNTSLAFFTTFARLYKRKNRGSHAVYLVVRHGDADER